MRTPSTLSLYLYAGAQPLKYVDPDGREIIVTGSEGERVQILAGLQELSNDVLSMDQHGRVGIVASQRDDSSRKLSSTLIQRMVESREEVSIGLGDESSYLAYSDDAFNGIGSSGEISWAPQEIAWIVQESSRAPDDPILALAEELLHADRAMRGQAIPQDIPAQQIFESMSGPYLGVVPVEEAVTNGLPNTSFIGRHGLRPAQLHQDITVNDIAVQRGRERRVWYD